MSSTEHIDPLDALAAKLPDEIQPQRDLWPEIAARLDSLPNTPRRPVWYAMAAGLALMAITAAVTWQIASTQLTTPPLEVMSTLDGDADYAPFVSIDSLVSMRAELMQTLNENFARLPAQSQRIIADNLLEIRNSLVAIEEALAVDPDNPSLQQLLYTTYDRELKLLGNMNRVALSLPIEVET